MGFCLQVFVLQDFGGKTVSTKNVWYYNVLAMINYVSSKSFYWTLTFWTTNDFRILSTLKKKYSILLFDLKFAIKILKMPTRGVRIIFMLPCNPFETDLTSLRWTEIRYTEAWSILLVVIRLLMTRDTILRLTMEFIESRHQYSQYPTASRFIWAYHLHRAESLLTK